MPVPPPQHLFRHLSLQEQKSTWHLFGGRVSDAAHPLLERASVHEERPLLWEQTSIFILDSGRSLLVVAIALSSIEFRLRAVPVAVLALGAINLIMAVLVESCPLPHYLLRRPDGQGVKNRTPHPFGVSFRARKVLLRLMQVEVIPEHRPPVVQMEIPAFAVVAVLGPSMAFPTCDFRSRSVPVAKLWLARAIPAVSPRLIPPLNYPEMQEEFLGLSNRSPQLFGGRVCAANLFPPLAAVSVDV